MPKQEYMYFYAGIISPQYGDEYYVPVLGEWMAIYGALDNYHSMELRRAVCNND